MLPSGYLRATLAVLSLGGAAAAWPIKTDDHSENGALCDSETEQYLQVEAYDYFTTTKITMTWMQLTGECGAHLDGVPPASWTGTYDTTNGDSPGSDGDAQRVQLNLFVCAPFGDYELTIDVNSSGDYEGAGAEGGRTSWEIENGSDQYHIWDTVNTNLKDDEDYSPTVPGTYTWPLSGATGYYKTLYAGPLPPIECSSSVPTGTEYVDCYGDKSNNRLFASDYMERTVQGPDGMTTHICSDFCADYDYFGVEYGQQCFCGTDEEFKKATKSEACGMTYQSLCTGDATTACGGSNAIGVYRRTDGSEITPAPAPTPAPSPTPTPPTGEAYTYKGCYVDSRSNRVMTNGKTAATDSMSAEKCYRLCIQDSANTHFGTEYGNECFCGVNPTLTLNGKVKADSECYDDCLNESGKCGDYNRISAFSIGGGSTGTGSSYQGCYFDRRNRAMPTEYKADYMTTEKCKDGCDDLGYDYAGTQYGKECWCGESFDKYGEDESGLACSSPCAGDNLQTCGGSYALSVYKV